MSLGLAFWILMLIWAVFGVLSHVEPGLIGGYVVFGNALLLFILFALVGWKVFGPPLHA